MPRLLCIFARRLNEGGRHADHDSLGLGGARLGGPPNLTCLTFFQALSGGQFSPIGQLQVSSPSVQSSELAFVGSSNCLGATRWCACFCLHGYLRRRRS